MIPFRGDHFDLHNNPRPMNRHLVLLPQQQQQILRQQPPALMFAPPTHNFHRPPLYAGGLPMQQQTVMLISPRQPPQQTWTLSPAPLPPAPTFYSPAPSISFHRHQPPLPPAQPSFSGGTALGFKRKSHYLEEADFEPPPNFNNDEPYHLPSLMSIPVQNFVAEQQHPHFRAINSRYMDQSGPGVRLPPPPLLPEPCLPPTGESFVSQTTTSHWTNNDRPVYHPSPQANTPSDDQQQQQLITTQLFQKHQLIPIDTLLKEPGRSQRPAQIIVFLRGLPGSGKSYVADLIKAEEETQSNGTNKPKIISIDNYFLTENEQETKDTKTGKITKTSVMEYEYDISMEETYRRSIIKSVRKSIDDRFYPFLIVDQNNEQLTQFREMADYAEANQFQVYFVELLNDPESCAQRNIHQRSLIDIRQIHKRWEQLPLRYEILDVRSLLQSDAIDEIEMDDAPSPTTVENNIEEQEKEENSQIAKKSKWEAMMETNPDRLDGLYQRRNSSSNRSTSPFEKRMSMTEDNADEISTEFQSKKKKVRWADVEENTVHLQKKAIGFVVGQTTQDWQRMSDDYDPSQKLNQYKYI